MEARLLVDAASQAALALTNVQLTTELHLRLADLRASRNASLPHRTRSEGDSSETAVYFCCLEAIQERHQALGCHARHR